MRLSRDTFLTHSGIVRQLAGFKVRFDEIQAILEVGEIYQDPKASKDLLIEYKKLEEILKLEAEFRRLTDSLADCQSMGSEGDDEEMKALVEAEKEEINKQLDKVFFDLQYLLIPKDVADVKNVMMEIRAGTGGGEASLFVADLFRLYTRFAEKKGWKLEVLSSSETELKGFKEIVFSIAGSGAYEYLKYETGAHRVQRIPETETSGRIHTSAVTVAVFPEAEEEEVEIFDKDLKIDTYRASGAGGQHVNTTDSAIRITYLPTNLVVTCQDERSQLKNKSKAMKILRSRIYEDNLRRQKEAVDTERRSQVGTGDRSDKIRTYNFPQGRITEHRTHFTLYKLQAAMDGDIDEIIESLRKQDLEEKLSQIVKA